MTSAQCTVATLWTLSSYTFRRFEHAPQLGIIAPASGHGKSTLRRVIQAMAHEPWHSDHATPAAIYRNQLERPNGALLFDEGENLNLMHSAKLRAIIDAAFQPDGCVDLVIDRKSVKVRLFAPVLWAIRGEVYDVPLAILSRSLIFGLQRGKPEVRFRHGDPELLIAREQNQKWAATCSLNPEPEVPSVLSRDSRVADICRPLLSIADSLERGDEARQALIEICAGRRSQDPGVQLLVDTRRVFDELRVDRITKQRLLIKVIELGDVYWSCWRGPNDLGKPHPLTKLELSSLLRRFGIHGRTVWPTREKSFPGYYREQLEWAWRTYCQDATTMGPTKLMKSA